MKPRVLLAIDRYGWAFHNIARQVVRLGDEFAFDVRPYHDVTRGEYDVVVAFWWPSVLRLRANTQSRAAVLCIYDGYSWNADPTTTHYARLAVKQSAVIGCANEAFAASFPNEEGRPVFVIEDGVDTQLFTPRELPETFTAGWVGNSMGAADADGPMDLKGLGILQRACELANVPLVLRDLQAGYVPHVKMPDWYAGVSVVLCGSTVEGTPNPVLEGMACGRPVITTDVGIVRKLVGHGENGLIVERDPEAFAEALRAMRAADLRAMGVAARAAAERHDWSRKAETWRQCLRAAAGEPCTD